MKLLLLPLAFLLSFNLFAFESNVEQVYLKGTFNNWSNNTNMYMGSDHTWLVRVNLESGDSFKFDMHGDWSENYGDNNNDGIAEFDGDNIKVADAGEYIIEFNDESKTYRVMIDYYTEIYAPVYHQSYVYGFPVKIFHEGLLYEKGSVNYGWRNGAFYFTRLPVGQEYTIEVGGVVEGHVQPGGTYQAAEFIHGRRTFVTSVIHEPQRLKLHGCEALSLNVLLNPGKETETLEAMQCVNGIWQTNVNFAAISEGEMPNSFLFMKEESDNTSLYGDDNADGIAGLNEVNVNVFEGGVHQVEIDLKTMEYNVSLKHIVTFSTHVSIQDSCWLDVRGDKYPLSWDRGVPFDNKKAGEVYREKIIVMDEGFFEYKYAKICEGDDNVYWELRGNRIGPSSGIDAPVFN